MIAIWPAIATSDRQLNTLLYINIASDRQPTRRSDAPTGDRQPPPAAAPASPPPVYQLAFFWFLPKKKRQTARQVQPSSFLSGRPLVQLPSRKGKERRRTPLAGLFFLFPRFFFESDCCPLCLPLLPSPILSHRPSCHIAHRISHILSHRISHIAHLSIANQLKSRRDKRQETQI